MSVAPRCARQGASLLLILSLGGACSPLRFPEDAGPDAAVVQFDAAPEHADATETPPDAGEPEPDAGPTGPLTITPSQVRLGALRPFTYRASEPVTWTIREENGGHIFADGLYGAPETPGVYHVVATSQVDATRTATALVTVIPLTMKVIAGRPGGYGDASAAADTSYFPGALGLTFLDSPYPSTLYVSDTSCRIRRRERNGGEMTTVVGARNDCRSVDGVGTAARLANPAFLVALESEGAMYFAEYGCIRKFHVGTSSVSTLAGTCGAPGHRDSPAGGSGRDALLHSISDMIPSPVHRTIYACESSGSENWLRRIDVASGVTTSIMQMSSECRLTLDETSHVYVAAAGDGVWEVAEGAGGLERDPTPIRVIPLDPGIVPGGLATTAMANGTLALDLLIASAPQILRWPLGSGNRWDVLTGVAGEHAPIDGPFADARLYAPHALKRNRQGTYLYDDNTFRRLTLDSVVTDYGRPLNIFPADGPLGMSRVVLPNALALDDDDSIYLGDGAFPGDTSRANLIRYYDIGSRELRSIAGAPTSFSNGRFVDGPGPEATLGLPYDMVRVGRTLYVLDYDANAIRSLNLATGGRWRQSQASSVLRAMEMASDLEHTFASRSLINPPPGGSQRTDRCCLSPTVATIRFVDLIR